MENKEIMANEEVMEVMTEEIATVDSGKNIAAVIGVAALVGGAIALGYKFVVKPIIAKVKAKKEQQELEVEDYTYADDDEV